MHLQVRLNPKLSPPDVEKVLDRLDRAGINLQGIGGSNVEFGGELALVPDHGQEDRALEVLAPYNPRVLYVDDPESGLKLCLVDNSPGALHRCLRDAAAENLERGRIIRDLLIGVPGDDDGGKIPVHIYSEVVRTPQSLSGAEG